MSKAVLLSIQPYYVFLIIAKAIGWNIEEEKTVEVRKNYPKAENWDKSVKIYCSKNKKSFAKIPKEYQPLMQKFLGKVIGEFTCSNISKGTLQLGSYLSLREISKYAGGKMIYGWCISDLVIYDEPKEILSFSYLCKEDCDTCKYNKLNPWANPIEPVMMCQRTVTKAPQSWCYVEEIGT